MKPGGAVPALLLALALAACGERQHNDTRVLGGQGGAPNRDLGGAGGLPAPPAPPRASPNVVRAGPDLALAAWVADDHVLASSWTRASGWSAPQPLERIYGSSSDLQLASNGQGVAMAVWHHQVGNIHSLRFSRHDGSGWSVPDVLPGALPRPSVAGTPPGQNAPQLQVDADGKVTARWPSGFHADEMQVAQHTPGEGWSRAATSPLASAPSASPPLPAASSAR